MQDHSLDFIKEFRLDASIVRSPVFGWAVLICSLAVTSFVGWHIHSEIKTLESYWYIVALAGLLNLLVCYVVLSLHSVRQRMRCTAQDLQQEFEISRQGLIMQARLVEATERESETFFQLAPEAFLVVSKAGIVVRANKYAHELFGYENGELLDLYLEELVPSSIEKEHASLRFEYFLKPQSRAMGGNRKLTAEKKHGETFNVTINLEPIEYRGDLHVVAAVHDVSIQKRLEETLANAKERAESASRSKSDFVANMSHEIRTPLNAVIGAAQLLAKTSPNNTQSKYIAMIRSSGEALLGVINDILDFSKIEAGCMELSPVSFDLSEVLARVGVMMSMNVGEKDIELVIHVDSDVSCHLTGDPLRLQQVLINLASNAIKFTDKGKVVLSVKALSMDDGLQKLKFSISDTGIGMTSAQQDRLFSAFSQADESITRRFGGTGLGLVISNRIIELMGTHIRVTSKVKEGTAFSFTVELPVDENHQGTPEPLEGSGIKLLMIDDSSDTCLSVKEILGAWGLQSWMYSSWGEAKAALVGTALIAEMDIVILDWQVLEGEGDTFLGGSNVLAQLRNMGLKDSCASVLSSNNNQCASLLMDGMQKKFDSGLVKPIARRFLQDSLHEALLNRTGKGVILHELEPPSVGRISGVSILLVEDNIFNQTIAQGLLEDMGAFVQIACNGAEAIELYKSDPDALDIILMDIQMPVMDGLTATKILRSELFNCSLPIIAMTAGVLQSERETYLNGGMDDLVPKPINENELFGAISRSMLSDGEASSTIKSVTAVTKPSIEAALVFNSARLELLSKGKSNRVKSIIDSIDSLTVNGEQSLMAAWQAVGHESSDQAHALFHDFKGQVANYGGEVLALSIQALEQGLRDGMAREDIQPLFSSIIHNYHEYIELALKWKDEQKKLFDEE